MRNNPFGVLHHLSQAFGGIKRKDTMNRIAASINNHNRATLLNKQIMNSCKKQFTELGQYECLSSESIPVHVEINTMLMVDHNNSLNEALIYYFCFYFIIRFVFKHLN